MLGRRPGRLAGEDFREFLFNKRRDRDPEGDFAGSKDSQWHLNLLDLLSSTLHTTAMVKESFKLRAAAQF